MNIESLKKQAIAAKAVKQCYGVRNGCPHCYFEVSPDDVIKLIERGDTWRDRSDETAAKLESQNYKILDLEAERDLRY